MRKRWSAGSRRDNDDNRPAVVDDHSDVQSPIAARSQLWRALARTFENVDIVVMDDADTHDVTSVLSHAHG